MESMFMSAFNWASITDSFPLHTLNMDLDLGEDEWWTLLVFLWRCLILVLILLPVSHTLSLKASTRYGILQTFTHFETTHLMIIKDKFSLLWIQSVWFTQQSRKSLIFTETKLSLCYALTHLSTKFTHHDKFIIPVFFTPICAPQRPLDEKDTAPKATFSYKSETFCA